MNNLTANEPLLMPENEWRALDAEHTERARGLTAKHLDRKARGEKHPIDDFLFTYYNLKPAQLAKWHPGAGTVLLGNSKRENWKYYVPKADGAAVDVAQFFEKRGKTVDYIENLFKRTLENTPYFGCFGLHEWAMVYKLSEEQIRHRGLPLRLGSLPTDVVVETNTIRCSHFDAYRFFTPEAEPLNELRPTRENQPDTEQSGCLHAGMDVYKWTLKLGPLIPGKILLDSFQLAWEIRQVDMQASPYDVSAYGLPPIKIETPEGKQEYAALQKDFAGRGNALRLQVLEALKRARTFKEQS